MERSTRSTGARPKSGQCFWPSVVAVLLLSIALWGLIFRFNDRMGWECRLGGIRRRLRRHAHGDGGVSAARRAADRISCGGLGPVPVRCPTPERCDRPRVGGPRVFHHPRRGPHALAHWRDFAYQRPGRPDRCSYPLTWIVIGSRPDCGRAASCARVRPVLRSATMGMRVVAIFSIDRRSGVRSCFVLVAEAARHGIPQRPPGPTPVRNRFRRPCRRDLGPGHSLLRTHQWRCGGPWCVRRTRGARSPDLVPPWRRGSGRRVHPPADRLSRGGSRSQPARRRCPAASRSCTRSQRSRSSSS